MVPASELAGYFRASLTFVRVTKALVGLKPVSLLVSLRGPRRAALPRRRIGSRIRCPYGTLLDLIVVPASELAGYFRASLTFVRVTKALVGLKPVSLLVSLRGP